MVKVLHFSDVHLGSGFCHGQINPATGLNTRFEDFVSSLGQCIDRAIAESVDLVLFSGDAFPNATPPPFVQQAFARAFHRLVEAGIPAVLLVGNHDQHSQGGGGASLSIYRTLAVPGMVVGDRLETHSISTKSGPVQVITVPWLTHSTLLARPDTDGSSIADVDQLLLHRFAAALEGEIRQLNPDIPTILLAHLMVDAAHYGAEKTLAVSKGFTVPLALLTRPCFDYVALGHVHRHQILCERPLTLYPGSIERVDFSEEKEEKGFVLVELQSGKAQAKFCPLSVRPFQTIELNISEKDNPQQVILKQIETQLTEDAVLRLIFKLRPDQIDQIDNAVIHDACNKAHTYTIRTEMVNQLPRQRLPAFSSEATLDPLDALKGYLAQREDLTEITQAMIEAAQGLLSGQTNLDLSASGNPSNHLILNSLAEDNAEGKRQIIRATDTQLRLL